MNISQPSLASLTPTWARSAVEAFTEKREVSGQTGQVPSDEETFMASGLMEIMASEIVKLDNGPQDRNREKGIIERDRAGQTETTYFRQEGQNLDALIVEENNVSLLHDGPNFSSLITQERGNNSQVIAMFLDHQDPSKSLVFE